LRRRLLIAVGAQEIDHITAVVARWLRNLAKSQPGSVLPDRVLEVWQLYEKAHAAICEHTPDATDRQVYDLLQEAMGHRKGGDRLPAFETITRYLRQARQALGLQKNSPRQQVSLKRRNRLIML